jgi:hypothetical protein
MRWFDLDISAELPLGWACMMLALGRRHSAWQADNQSSWENRSGFRGSCGDLRRRARSAVLAHCKFEHEDGVGRDIRSRSGIWFGLSFAGHLLIVHSSKVLAA